MQNTKISITPLHVCYTCRKTLSILIKLKRVLISTNYELQKFQCKKQIPLKNGLADLSPYLATMATTFSFKLSKEMELGNTKVDIIIFGFVNKDVNLLGIATLDLAIYKNLNFKDQPVQQEVKLNLEKSQDPHSYVMVNLLIENVKKLQKPTSRQIKSNSDGFNTLKTQSYNRQSLLIGRRKNPDLPTGYEISRKNYKQTEVVRIIQQRSHSKSRNDSGSYKKRFEYQYKKQITSKEQQQLPQAPPSQRVQKKSQLRGSPMPRIKTPEPITFNLDTQTNSKKQKNKRQVSSQRNIERTMNNHQLSEPNNHKKHQKLHNQQNNSSKYRTQPEIISEYERNQQVGVKNSQLKILIDVHKGKKYQEDKDYDRYQYQSQQQHLDPENSKRRQIERQSMLRQIQLLKQRRQIQQRQKQRQRQRQRQNQRERERQRQKQRQSQRQKVKQKTVQGGSGKIKKQQTLEQKSKYKPNIPSLNLQSNPDINPNQSIYSRDTYSNSNYNSNPNPNPQSNSNFYPNPKKPNNSYKQIKSDRDYKNMYDQQSSNRFNNQKFNNRFDSHTYNEYRHAKSYQQQPTDRNNNNNKYQGEDIYSIYQENQQKETPRYPQQSNLNQIINNNFNGNKNSQVTQPKQDKKRNNSNESDNRFKSIVDKFQKIEQKIKQANKSASPSPRLNKDKQSIDLQMNKKIISQKDKLQKEQYAQIDKKPFSPFKVDKNKDKQKTKVQQSANTFGQKSQYDQESSPGCDRNQKSQFVHSFQSNIGQSSQALGSIIEDKANFSVSDSSIQINQNNFRNKNQKQRQQAYPEHKNTKVNEDDSIAHFSVSDKDWSENAKVKEKYPVNKQNNQRVQKQDQVNQEKREKNLGKKNQFGRLKKTQEEFGVQTSTKKQQTRQKNIIILPQFQIKIAPQPGAKKLQNKTSISQSLQKEQIDPKIKATQNQRPQKIQSQDKRVSNLQHLLDQQQQDHRKILLERELQHKNYIKKSEKRCKQYEEELKQLKQQNSRLKQKQNQFQQLNKKQSNNSDTKEVNRLKDQNMKLRSLVEKLNAELEQSDQKHFQALTSTEKKDLQYQRKLDGYLKKNQQLTEQIRKKQEQLKQYIQKSKSQPQNISVSNPTQKNQKDTAQITTSENEKNNEKNSKKNPPEEQKRYKQQFLAQKKKNVNLQAQIRIKDNQLRFLKIKNENLEEQKKNLQNQIDNIAANNKLELAKQGSIAKMNLEAVSLTDSVKVQNKVLKQQINSLQRQVHELNTLLDGMITQEKFDNQRISSSRYKSQRQNEQNLVKKYQALQKKTQAYQQELKNKQMKIAEIINTIFSYNNPKLVDEVSKIVEMGN